MIAYEAEAIGPRKTSWSLLFLIKLKVPVHTLDKEVKKEEHNLPRLKLEFTFKSTTKPIPHVGGKPQTDLMFDRKVGKAKQGNYLCWG